MDQKFDAIINKMQLFLNDESNQTAEFAMRITSDPLYKEFKKNLSAIDAVKHPVFMKFIEKSKAVLTSAAVDKFKGSLQKQDIEE